MGESKYKISNCSNEMTLIHTCLHYYLYVCYFAAHSDTEYAEQKKTRPKEEVYQKERKKNVQ